MYTVMVVWDLLLRPRQKRNALWDIGWAENSEWVTKLGYTIRVDAGTTGATKRMGRSVEIRNEAERIDTYVCQCSAPFPAPALLVIMHDGS